MWEVLALEADSMPPELADIAGDYGHTTTTFSLERASRDGSIALDARGAPAAYTKDGITYPLTVSGPSAYNVTVRGARYTVRMYFYCAGAAQIPENAAWLECPLKRSQKTPCAFGCKDGYKLSVPALSVGSLACTPAGSYADSTCVNARPEPVPQVALPATARPEPVPAARPEGPVPPAVLPAQEKSGQSWVWIVIGIGVLLLSLFAAAAVAWKRGPRR